MAVRTKSRVTPKFKRKYRVTNWAAYEASLRKRGDITVWFNDGAIAEWKEEPSGISGGQRKYSDLAILTALTLGTVFHLPLRQTEGFVGSLLAMLGLPLDSPDHTTLSRRGAKLDVPPMAIPHEGPIHLVIDSTGLEFLGDGEWHTHEHNTKNKRRSWRELHLGVDANGFIVSSRLTESGAQDAPVGAEMIANLGRDIERFTSDGAYDTREMYSTLEAKGTPDLTIVIPPKRKAAIDSRAQGAWRQRNDALTRIGIVGRRQWRKESGGDFCETAEERCVGG